MTITLIILAISAILFVSGKLRSDLVAICSALALVLTGILSPEEALSGFSNPIVIMMGGLFIVGGGIFGTGLAKRIGSGILGMAGTNETRLFILLMLTTAGVGAFVSNTGTVAIMLPIVVSMARGAGLSPSRMLMPLAFAGSMGGMLTLIGTYRARRTRRGWLPSTGILLVHPSGNCVHCGGYSGANTPQQAFPKGQSQ